MSFKDTIGVGIIRKLSEDVINKIAAGEVIQRPFSVVKELVENCLDAGSTSIQITIKNGGLKVIKIQDDGCGIKKEDLPLACERFTTSKLTTFDDLKSMQTYGFRGEALSSVSQVARVTITSKVETEECGFKLSYLNGKPIGSPTPIAANKGTVILVEDLFYNMMIRKNALKSDSNEHNLIVDVINKYALHNCHQASFVLKKLDASKSDIFTSKGITQIDAIKTIYGENIAKDLVFITDSDDQKLKFSLNGLISNSNASLKKINLILFINNRLVENNSLKQSIESVYSKYLPKSSHAFVYLSLLIIPSHLDVNIHPTKNEVGFLHEAEICSRISELIESQLSRGESSKNFISPKVIEPKISFVERFNHLVEIKKSPSQLTSEIPNIGLSSKMKEQDTFHQLSDHSPINSKYNVSNQTTTTPKSSYSRPKYDNSLNINGQSYTHINVKKTPKRPSETVRHDSNERKIDYFFTPTTKEAVTQSPRQANHYRRVVNLKSVLNLRKQVGQNRDQNLQDVICNSNFVGSANERFVLIQHETQLMLMNLENVNRELFYQIYLSEFSNFGVIKLSRGLKVSDLVQIYLDRKPHKANSINPQVIEQFLIDKSEMLDDYFSIMINSEGHLLTLPLLLKDHTPNMAFLPTFIIALFQDVNWNEEEGCFQTIGTVLSHFYSKPPTQLESEEERMKWNRTIEYSFYPAFKSILCPTNKLANECTFTVAANLTDLYKVFERC